MTLSSEQFGASSQTNAGLYKHQPYAGSIGDLWKHGVLESVLSEIPANGKPYHFVDCHAGYGVYSLRPGGRWYHGIGKLARDRNSLLQCTTPLLRDLETFQEKNFYEGSWARVRYYSHKISELTLIDHSAAVTNHCRDLSTDKVFDSLAPKVLHKDYIEALSDIALNSETILFFDPAFRRKDGTGCDWQRLRLLASTLKKSPASFMIWYPVYGEREPSSLIQAYGLTSFEAYWTRRKKTAFSSLGCGMLLSTDLFDLVGRDQRLQHLTEVLGLELRLRKGSP